jgi:hypothetical protein
VLAKTNREQADTFAASLKGMIADIKADGYKTVRAIATELNRRGVLSARGGTWSAKTTHRLLNRLVRVAGFLFHTK